MNSLVLTFKEGEPPHAGWYLVRPDGGDMAFDVDYWNPDGKIWSNWIDVINWAELPVA